MRSFIVLGIFFPALIFAQQATPATLQELSSLQERYDMLVAEEKAEKAAEAARLRLADRPKGSAKHISPNFEVTAPTYEIAEKVCLAAEAEWAKSGLPNLYMPCKIRVKVGQIGAGGATTFSFGGGQVFGFDMTVQGDLERILDSVILHEVRHMITACKKRRPVARWLDEGIADLCEIDSERNRQLLLAKEIVGTKRPIPLRELLSEMDYSKNMQELSALYAVGTALSDFLVTRAAAASKNQWTLEEALQWIMDFEEIAYKKGWDATLYDLSEKKDKPLGNITNTAELSNEFTKWLKNGNARIYAFKEVPPSDSTIPVVPNEILPVNNTDLNRKVIPLGR